MSEARIGRYMHTSNGQKYWPLDPRADEIHIEVVAHHLANKCRYAGATQHPTELERIFYSVAEHSIYVAEEPCPEGYDHDLWEFEELERLLHDAPEFAAGDLIRPLKYDELFAAPYKKVEALNEVQVAKRFGLIHPFPASVKIADEAVTAAEVNQIIVKDPSLDFTVGHLHDRSLISDRVIEMWDPYTAKVNFLAKYKEVMRKRVVH